MEWGFDLTKLDLNKVIGLVDPTTFSHAVQLYNRAAEAATTALSAAASPPEFSGIEGLIQLKDLIEATANEYEIKRKLLQEEFERTLTELVAKRDQLEAKITAELAEEHQLKQRVNVERQRLLEKAEMAQTEAHKQT